MLALLLAAAVLQAGDPAPPIAAQQLLQAPEGAAVTWPALRGKAVVLEFWATWCGPCVERIPHWNALVEKFKGRPIQFIAISPEEEEVVRAFLAKRPMAGWIVMDPSDETFNAYGIESVPQTVLVDAKGVVRAITSPQNLTDAELEKLMGGGEIKVANAPAPG